MIMGTVISPLGKQRERLWVFVCVSGERVGGTEIQTISTSLPKPPTAVPCTKTRAYINHTHSHTNKTELARSRFETDIIMVGTKEE